MNGFAKRSELKRQDILTAASAIFSQKGVSHATVDEIASQAKVSKVTIFKYFTDKQGLAREVLQPMVEEWTCYYEELADMNIPLEEKFKRMLQHKASMREDAGEQIWQEMILKDRAMQSLVTEITESRQEKIFLQIMNDGQDRCEVDSSLTDEALRIFFHSFRSLYGTEAFARATPQTKEALMKLFMNGVTGK